MNAADLAVQVEKLSPQAGDVLVVRIPFLDASQRAEMEDAVQAQGLSCAVLIVPRIYNLTLLDEAGMRALGWVRADPHPAPAVQGEAVRRRGYEFL